MRTTGDPGTVSPLYEFLDEHMPGIRLRAIELRIKAGTYEEEAAIPTVVDRLTKELQDGNERA